MGIFHENVIPINNRTEYMLRFSGCRSLIGPGHLASHPGHHDTSALIFSDNSTCCAGTISSDGSIDVGIVKICIFHYANHAAYIAFAPDPVCGSILGAYQTIHQICFLCCSCDSAGKTVLAFRIDYHIFCPAVFYGYTFSITFQNRRQATCISCLSVDKAGYFYVVDHCVSCNSAR